MDQGLHKGALWCHDQSRRARAHHSPSHPSIMNRAYLVGNFCKQTNRLKVNDGAYVDLLIPPNKEFFLKDISSSQFIQITGDIWRHPSRQKSVTVRVAVINKFAADPTPSSFVVLNMEKFCWNHYGSFNSQSFVQGLATNAQPVWVKMPLIESRWAKTVGDILNRAGSADLWLTFRNHSELHCLSIAEDRTSSENCLALPGTSNPKTEKKKSNRAGIPPKLRHEIFQRDEFICQHCGASPRKDPSVAIEVDHIVPVSKGGTNEKSNLQTLCNICNAGKGNSMPREINDPWFEQKAS